MPVDFRPTVPPPPADAPRLNVREGDPVEMTPPRSLNGWRLREEIAQQCADVRGRAEGMVDVYVSEAGVPVAIFLGEPSGDPATDRALIYIALRFRFAPAALPDGTPVAVWAKIPVECRLG